jgi:hypothetical protein
MVDIEGGNNLLYLPLDQLTKQRPSTTIDQTMLDNAVDRILRDETRARSNNSRIRN